MGVVVVGVVVVASVSSGESRRIKSTRGGEFFGGVSSLTGRNIYPPNTPHELLRGACFTVRLSQLSQLTWEPIIAREWGNEHNDKVLHHRASVDRPLNV